MDQAATHPSTASGPLRIVIVTPEQTVLDAVADFVALPLFDGELGVAAGHAPMIGRLGYGELRLGHAPSGQRYYVDGGFVQIAGNVVSVLTNRALPAARLDAAALEGSIRDARALPAAGEDQIAARARSVAQARAQLRVARGGRAGAAAH